MVDVAPPGAAEDHRSCSDVQTKHHHFCYTYVCLCCLPNSCEKHVLLKRSSLGHASRSLSKTGSVLCSFRCSFLGHALKCFREPLGAIGVDLGAIWAAFWGHFGDFFRLRGIFENVCFTNVKPCFLRFGRVPDRDFFVLFF